MDTVPAAQIRRGIVDAIDLTALPAWGALGLTPGDVEPVLEAVSSEAQAARGLFG